MMGKRYLLKKLVLLTLIIGLMFSLSAQADPEPLTVVDFQACENMGAAVPKERPGDILEQDCLIGDDAASVRLRYALQEDDSWVAFWVLLDDLDFSVGDVLAFEARADIEDPYPERMKIELYRNSDVEAGIVYFPVDAGEEMWLTDAWNRFSVRLDSFLPVDGKDPLAGADLISKLVFTFEEQYAGPTGTLFLRNIVVTNQPDVIRVAPNEAVNVRSGPGLDYPIVDQLQGNQGVLVSSQDETGHWLSIDDSHWVASSVVFAADDIMGLPVYEVPQTLMVADFDNCVERNSLGFAMGAAYEQDSGNMLTLRIVPDAEDGCIAQLDYDIVTWSAYWNKLERVNFNIFNTLTFDVKAEVPVNQIKVELKRGGDTWITYLSDIPTVWTKFELEPKDFQILSFLDFDEIVFTFEKTRSGAAGTVFLDNIAFHQ